MEEGRDRGREAAGISFFLVGREVAFQANDECTGWAIPRDDDNEPIRRYR